MIKVYCNGTRIQCLRQGELTAGMVGAPIEFDFSEEWNGLGKTAVFRCDGERDVILGADKMAVVPHEILTTPGMDVEVGVYAAKEAGTTWPAPTPFCRIGRVKEGADPSGDESYPPTPDVGAQAVAAASSAMQAAAAAQEVAAEIQRRADNGEFDGAPGYTPVKGKDYFDGKDGDDYVLTEADKAEIAEIAADLVDVPEGKVELDTTLTQPGRAADAKAVGDALENVGGKAYVQNTRPANMKEGEFWYNPDEEPDTPGGAFDTYTKAEIDAIMGNYITDINNLVGGGA